MNNRKSSTIKRLALCVGLPALLSVSVYAQKLTGYIISSTNQPVADAVITCPGCQTSRSATDGSFSIDSVKAGSTLSVWHDGFFRQSYIVKSNVSQSGLKIYMIEDDKSRYNETFVLPFRNEDNNSSIAGVTNVSDKDFYLGSMELDRALQGEVAGLQVINKSGMPGEGAYMALRGIHSLNADNSPLIVLNGVPYMPDKNESQIIGGLSRSIFQSLNNLDIKNITVLKGADAALYGSMGSNGVIMIETKDANRDNMDTKISFSALYGFNWNSKRIPLMNSSEYKSYLSDAGLAYYSNMESFFKDFSFLSDPKANYSYMYKNNTDWQDVIYRNSNTKDFLFRVEGGDAIAKYNISLGYTGDDGTIKNTDYTRYNAQINTSIMVSKKFEIKTNINAAYVKSDYQEQGMSNETSSIMAAYRRSPLLSPYKYDIYGNELATYASYYYGAITNSDFIVSNPLSLVNTLVSNDRQYDINAKIQFTYRPITNLDINAVVGMYYNYNQEEEFIPGMNFNDIAPLFDLYGKAQNSTRVATAHTFNMFYNLFAKYQYELNAKNKFNFMAGMQILTTSDEYDAGYGRNSQNDFYQTLGDAQTIGRYFTGFNDKWNWANGYIHADYTFNNLLKLGVNASFDGASSTGEDATRMVFHPAGEAVLMAKQFDALNKIEWLNKLNIYANYGVTGNSRYSSKMGKYYYTSQPYQTISGIVRANVPNTELKPEKDYTLNVGFESSFIRNTFSLGVGYYDIQSRDVLIAGNKSSVFGTGRYYCNDASLGAHGFEISAQVAPVYNKDFRWIIGTNVATLSNKVKSLGSESEYVTSLYDEAALITRVGESPYNFYGYQTAGVFSTTAEAKAAKLTNRNGIAYKAGDVHYVDQNHDNVIDDNDRVLLGSASPKFYGDVYTRLEYKNLALDLTFGFSSGNKAYNAVRRVTESECDFANQSKSVIRRWSMEGQVTDMPRVVYGDAIGNNDFSDRWIEDASYIKLRNITLSYTYDKPLFKLIQSGTIYITGQNLFCMTNYLGLDPEMSYSYSSALQGVDYGKATAPRSFKLGINLKF